MDLLANTGMEDCDDWLRLLQDTDVNTIALNHIARHIKNKGKKYETVNITDTTIASATALLPHIPRKNVIIVLLRRGDMSELCRATANHTLKELSLYHHYRNPDLPAASDNMLRDLPR